MIIVFIFYINKFLHILIINFNKDIEKEDRLGYLRFNH